jgi:lipopolysaccharide transport system ATP-binding protein
MTKKEIASKLDEIIEFSGCERYVDTPTKRYSSGMTVRLAFAVAAFLEPEILIVDEVLAVGDAEFQKKAIGKMKDISREGGRTVLFVSHNMASVKSLCTRGIMLENGIVTMDDTIDKVVSRYLSGNNSTTNVRRFDKEHDTDYFHLKEINLRNKGKAFDDPLLENEEIILSTQINIKVAPEKYRITYHLFNEIGDVLFSFYDNSPNSGLVLNENTLECQFPAHFFQSGNFSLALFIVEDKKKSVYRENNIMQFTVVDGGRDLGVYMGREPGNIRPQFHWKNLSLKV